MRDNVEEAKELLKIGNIRLAEIIIERLEQNSKYETVANKLRQESKNLKKLLDAFNSDDFFLCYKLLDSNCTLKHTDLGKYLQEKWNIMIGNCEKLVIKGKINALEESLGLLKKLPSRSVKVGDLLRLSYRSQINHHIKKALYEDAEKLILIYLNIFGIDTELNNSIKLYTKVSSLKISLTPMQLRRKPRDFWLYIAISP
jgi:hypothetical protein